MTDDIEQFVSRQKKLVLDDLADVPLDIAYTDVGEGDPVIVLHGIPTWSYLYHDVIPLLESHCRVLAPDFLGHGYSDKRDQFDRSLRAQARMILSFMDALDINEATVVGHDTGGGVALIRAISSLEGATGDADGETQGINIVRRALEEPLRQIVGNAGLEGAIIVENVATNEGNYGYNAATEEYGDLVEMGVIDPTKVVHTALGNAASIAALLLTTEAIVADEEEEEEAGAGGHGHAH